MLCTHTEIYDIAGYDIPVPGMVFKSIAGSDRYEYSPSQTTCNGAYCLQVVPSLRKAALLSAPWHVSTIVIPISRRKRKGLRCEQTILAQQQSSIGHAVGPFSFFDVVPCLLKYETTISIRLMFDA